ncbi:MAG TPA: alpha/beta hydrolase [Sediminibacterium sp.]|nr:alpha/beta hydrolase [Sediminibacterium sp.]
MKKFLRYIGYFFGSLLVLLVLLFIIYFQPDRSLDELKPLCVNNESEFMPLMGMNVHYRDQGNPTDSVPLVLIHGTSSSLHTFEAVVKKINPNRRVITLDMPAFGLTGPNATNEYSFKYYSQFLDSFLTKLQIPLCDIGGNSLGGGIAWQFTTYFPNKVRKLILIDATGYPVMNVKGSIGFKIASTPVINNVMLFITPKALVRASLKGIYQDPSIINQEQIDRFHDMAIAKGNRKALLAIFKKGLEQEPEKIKTIQKPTIIIWGDKDGLIPVQNASLFNKDIKGSKLAILKNIGHVPMEEDPTKTAALINEF